MNYKELTSISSLSALRSQKKSGIIFVYCVMKIVKRYEFCKKETYIILNCIQRLCYILILNHKVSKEIVLLFPFKSNGDRGSIKCIAKLSSIDEFKFSLNRQVTCFQFFMDDSDIIFSYFISAFTSPLPKFIIAPSRLL